MLGLRSWLPDALVALSCVAALLTVPTAWQVNRWLVVPVVVGVSGAWLLWLLRRRAAREPRAASSGAVVASTSWNGPAFAAVVGVAFLASDGAMVLPLVLVAALVVVLDRGMSWGAGYLAVLVVGSAAVMRWGHGVGWLSVLVQVLALVLMMSFGLAYAGLLRHSERMRAERADAVDELDRANTALREANAQLRRSAALERDLVLARERARAAGELHDGLGHRLTVVTMSLDFAERMRERDPERAWQEVRGAREQTTEAMSQMRMWVRALHPVDVGGLTDVAAFDAIAQAFRGTGLDVRISHQGSSRPLPTEVSLLCHRAVQEGLTNALRHARATRVDIALEVSADRLSISLHDNGVGLGDAGEGFGLRGLRERAEALGGRAGVESAGAGTTLTIEVPLPRAGDPVGSRGVSVGDGVLRAGAAR